MRGWLRLESPVVVASELVICSSGRSDDSDSPMLLAVSTTAVESSFEALLLGRERGTGPLTQTKEQNAELSNCRTASLESC